jgi:hypothetical protein
MTGDWGPNPHDSRHCGALKKQPVSPGERCRRPSGWGTTHVGFGRCKLHGGATRYRHGRHSVVVQRHHLPAVRETMKNYAVKATIDLLTVLVPDDALRLELFKTIFEAAGLARRDEWPESTGHDTSDQAATAKGVDGGDHTDPAMQQ